MRAKRYLFHLPKTGEVPPGLVVVHNHVPPTRVLGRRGFRAWIQPPDGAPSIEVCPCEWAPELGQHYRVVGTTPPEG